MEARGDKKHIVKSIGKDYEQFLTQKYDRRQRVKNLKNI